ncbi:nuclear transport factor 2 family protein [Glutamicibacter halophytocola]|uniref:YybH family protein n=1 Tax=Glutamicibacter halophytocola TaxID=1933880 RepID=UPI00096B3F80
MTSTEDSVLELTRMMREYEAANNSRVLDRVLAHISPEASYWFSDGSYYGHEEIRVALQNTFDTIQNEVYSIHDLAWVTVKSDIAVCRYHFSWIGLINGQPRSGTGRGTNVLVRHKSGWLIEHEQLTSDG